MTVLSVIIKPCFCEAHLGDEIRQATVQLDNGRIVIAQDDGRGTHYWIGARSGIGTPRQAFPWEVGEILQAVQIGGGAKR